MPALVAGLAAFAPPALANFTSAQLSAIAAAPPPDATLPLDLAFHDENGRPLTIASAIGGVPAIVVFADFTCHTLCGPILDFTAAGLARTGLQAGRDFRLLVIGLDPNDNLDAARAMRAQHLGVDNPIAAAAVVLTGSAATIHAATAALGLRYAYDAEHDQYAHPAAAYVLDSTGRVHRVLSPLGLDGGDLRLAIVDAGNGAVGNLADRVHLLCYGYDPAKGVYTERVTTVLGYAAGTTLILLLSGIGAMVARERRSAAT